jgi:NAD(P) transhydrogenase subunit alpha
VITIDWSDEILAKTVLTHAGEDKRIVTASAAVPIKPKPAALPNHAAA